MIGLRGGSLIYSTIFIFWDNPYNIRCIKLGNQKDKRGFLVRVPRDVETLVKLVSEKLGYFPHSVRSVAILHGLMTIATTKTIPRDDQEFQVLLENVRDLLRKNLGVDV
jgi:hypothetical protein